MEAAVRRLRIVQETPETPKRIRGPHLHMLFTSKNKEPLWDKFQKTDSENLVVASNKRLDVALWQGGEWRLVPAAFPCVSGTIAGYVEPGKQLGREISYVDRHGHRWIFPVPVEFQKEKNAVVVAEHPDFTLETVGKYTVVHAAAVALIQDFPAKNGCYMTELAHNITVARFDPSREPTEELRIRAKIVEQIYLFSRKPVTKADILANPHKEPHEIYLAREPVYGPIIPRKGDPENPYARHLHRIASRVGPVIRCSRRPDHIFLDDRNGGIIVEDGASLSGIYQ